MNVDDLIGPRQKWPASERGRTVAILRKRLGITQDRLAKLGTISRVALYNFETGRSEPTIETELRIVNTLIKERLAKQDASEFEAVYGHPMTKLKDLAGSQSSAETAAPVTPEQAVRAAFYARIGQLQESLQNTLPVNWWRVYERAALDLVDIALAAPADIREELAAEARKFVVVAHRIAGFERRYQEEREENPSE